MSSEILKRTTFVVGNAGAAAQFYLDVFGWTVWYDNSVEVDARFPPSGAADMALAKLIILQAADPKIGKLGFLQYLDPPFDSGTVKNRTKIRMGEPILVIETEDADAVHDRAVTAGARIVSAPADWCVPAADGQAKIHLRTTAFFDPNGIYMEVSAHP